MQDAILEKLERLAKLKADGELNAAQYDQAKAALLMPDAVSQPVRSPEDWSSRAHPLKVVADVEATVRLLRPSWREGIACVE